MVRGRIPEDRADDILNAARNLLLEQGSKAVTMEAVAKLAGVGKGTIFLYWSSKAHLMDAIFNQDLAELLKTVQTDVAAQSRTFCLSLFMHIVLQAQMSHPIVDTIFRSKVDKQKLDDKILKKEIMEVIPVARSHGMLQPISDEEIAIGIQALMLGLLHINFEDPAEQCVVDLAKIIQHVISSTYERSDYDVSASEKLAQEVNQRLLRLIDLLASKAAPTRRRRSVPVLKLTDQAG